MYYNILTIHKEPNYGACLQAYALYRKIKELGGQPRIINLSLDFRHRPYNRLNKLLIEANKLIKGYKRCYDIAEEFSRNYCPSQIGDFYSFEDLSNFPWDENDAYIVGSDQVWNPAITADLSNCYNLSFLPDRVKLRYSYASSFGSLKSDAYFKSHFCVDSFSRFIRIGVREQFGVDYLKSLGYGSEMVVDPTLLLDNYEDLIEGNVERKAEILFLSLSDTKDMNEFVNKMSQELNLPVKKLFGYLQPNRKTNMDFVKIEEWLRCIASAEVIVTDSFHASVFSIIFERPFYVYISAKGKEARISNLFDSLGIDKRRIIKASQKCDIVDAPIDFKAVKQRLSELRLSSVRYLKEVIDEGMKQ